MSEFPHLPLFTSDLLLLFEYLNYTSACIENTFSIDLDERLRLHRQPNFDIFLQVFFLTSQIRYLTNNWDVCVSTAIMTLKARFPVQAGRNTAGYDEFCIILK